MVDYMLGIYYYAQLLFKIKNMAVKKRSKSDVHSDFKSKIMNDIFAFCEVTYGLTPQPMYSEYYEKYWNKPLEWTAEMFGKKVITKYKDEYVISYNWKEYELGRHLTWQQTKVLKIVQNELDRCKNTRDLFKLKFAITSARGVGKTTIMSILTWFFYLRRLDIGGMVIAPTSASSSATVWSEMDIWLKKTPSVVLSMADDITPIIKTDTSIYRDSSEIPDKYSITKRSINKDNTGAIAGFHAPFVIYQMEEASAIPDSVVDTLVNGFNAYEEHLVMMVSNPRKTAGCKRFEEAVTDPESGGFISFSFSGEESPLRSSDESLGILKKNYNRGGRSSSSYLVEALGEYSDELLAIPDGWITPVNSIADLDIRENYEPESKFTTFGVDPSGGSTDNAVVIARNSNCFKIIVNKLYPRETTHRDLTVDIVRADIIYNPDIVYIDNFGVGANTAELVKEKLGTRSHGYNIGNQMGDFVYDKRRFKNFRSQQIHRFFNLICPAVDGKEKAILIGTRADWAEILNIYYRENNGVIEYIKKDDLKAMGFDSPNLLDACVHSMFNYKEDITFKDKEENEQEEAQRAFEKRRGVLKKDNLDFSIF